MAVPKCPPSILLPYYYSASGWLESYRWVIMGKEPHDIMSRYDQNSRGRDSDINTSKLKNIVNPKRKSNDLDNMVLLNFYVITHNVFFIKDES